MLADLLGLGYGNMQNTFLISQNKNGFTLAGNRQTKNTIDPTQKYIAAAPNLTKKKKKISITLACTNNKYDGPT